MNPVNESSLTKFMIQDRCGGRDARVACFVKVKSRVKAKTHLLNLIASVAEVILLDLHGLNLLLDSFHLGCVLAGDLT